MDPIRLLLIHALRNVAIAETTWVELVSKGKKIWTTLESLIFTEEVRERVMAPWNHTDPSAGRPLRFESWVESLQIGIDLIGMLGHSAYIHRSRGAITEVSYDRPSGTVHFMDCGQDARPCASQNKNMIASTTHIYNLFLGELGH